MPAYRIDIAPAARRQLKKFSAPVRRQCWERIRSLAQEPRPDGCEKLAGVDQWRVRVGRYRIIYAVFDKQLVVLVAKVAHRKEAYR
jgi:mRNA interferase RelE/StbE